MSYLLIHGDARRLPIDPGSIDAIVSDPPYGMNWDTDSRRFTGGDQPTLRRHVCNYPPIANDDKPFDPSPWVNFDRVILWGSNHFGRRLPKGTSLVWIKRNDDAYGSFLSDAEIAWMKGGHGVYCFKDVSMNNAFRNHPNQKPVSLMRWCIQKLKLAPNSLILDPYMGSGTTAIAAIQEGHRFIGIDIERKYVQIAQRRLERPHQAVGRPGKTENLPLFGEPA